MKEKLPVSYLLFTRRGRINRLTFWNAQVFIWLAFYVLYNGIELFFGFGLTIIIYPILYWALYCTASKRLHDHGKSSWFLLLTLIPVLGPFWLLLQLGFKKGNPERNKYGLPQGHKDDYFINPKATKIPHLQSEQRIVNDVTQLNPIIVSSVFEPKTIDELIEFIRNSNVQISIGGGRFSMGGQTALDGTVHIDMRGLNLIEAFDLKNKTITVLAGTRWCDIQKHIDPHNLSVKIMQSYANFTVGGSLSVNAHGRYIGLGPVILSVKSIDVLMANGEIISASPVLNSDIFNGSIGGYNALGIIVRASLELSENFKMKRISRVMNVEDFSDFFQNEVRRNRKAIMHNTDIYPDKYKRIRATTWVETNEKSTKKTRLVPLKGAYPIERYFLWAFSETPFGKWRRQHIVEPIVYFKKRVHWRNYEAGYDVAELEPKSRKRSTYVLREFFIPKGNFIVFVHAMAEIFRRHKVNVINVSIRHSEKDSTSFLSWAPEEMFAFVVYYKQGVREYDKAKVGVWTREMNQLTISLSGTFYLPYQIFATDKQFQEAYPNAIELFKLKQKWDPDNKFTNRLWDRYFSTKIESKMETNAEFKKVMSDTVWNDRLFLFLQVIFHLYPEDKFHDLIKDACNTYHTDREIYEAVQNKLASIKPFLSEFTYSLPALKKQKQEMTSQTKEILKNPSKIDGYLEIGSTGRYISHLRKEIPVDGQIYLQNDVAPGFSIGDFFERGRISKIGTFIDLEYNPITEVQIPTNSLDVVTCFIGLHHCPSEKLEDYLLSIKRILRPNGKFVIRDHDCETPEMVVFASLIHTVFNLGLKESWDFNSKEYRNFKSINEWVAILEKLGFEDTKQRVLQKNDPSLNTLVCLINKK